MGAGITRVQLWRLRDRDRDGAWAYGWRTTVTRAPGRRSWSEGVLLAHPEHGVIRLEPDVEGLMTAIAVLAEERQHSGHLPTRIDRQLTQPPLDPDPDARMPGRKTSRYDRYGNRETLGERAARQRREDEENSGR